MVCNVLYPTVQRKTHFKTYVYALYRYRHFSFLYRTEKVKRKKINTLEFRVIIR